MLSRARRLSIRVPWHDAGWGERLARNPEANCQRIEYENIARAKGVAESGMSQSNVSGHLACLKYCGLVADRPEGRAVYYRNATAEVFELLRAAEVLLNDVGQQIASCPNW